MIENWRDLVGYQPYGDQPQPWWKRTWSYLHHVFTGRQQKIYYLTVKPKPTVGLSIQILSESIACTLSESKMHQQLDAILTSFPKSNYSFSDIGKARAGTEVARQSRRGIASTEYKHSIFYCGTNQFDRAVFVTERGGLFGIFKHPNFDQYGFTL